MPLGHLLDQREIYEQLQGWKKPKQEFYINDILKDVL